MQENEDKKLKIPRKYRKKRYFKANFLCKIGRKFKFFVPLQPI
jgi:hypothetical protein